MSNAKCQDDRYPKRKINIEKSLPYTISPLERTLKMLFLPYSHTYPSWCLCTPLGSIRVATLQEKVASILSFAQSKSMTGVSVITWLKIYVNSSTQKSPFGDYNLRTTWSLYEKKLLEIQGVWWGRVYARANVGVCRPQQEVTCNVIFPLRVFLRLLPAVDIDDNSRYYDIWFTFIVPT